MTATPMAVVRAHVRMQPRIEAEESLAAVNRLLIGTRNAVPESASSIMRQWQRTAEYPDTLVARGYTGKVTAAHREAIKRLGVRQVPGRG